MLQNGEGEKKKNDYVSSSHYMVASRLSLCQNEANLHLIVFQVVCYWGTWANYRPKLGQFKPENIEPDLCTHLIYSFAGLDDETWAIKSLDPWMDLQVMKLFCPVLFGIP